MVQDQRNALRIVRALGETAAYLAAAQRARMARRCLATSEGRPMSAQALDTTSGGRSSATDDVLLPAGNKMI